MRRRRSGPARALTLVVAAVVAIAPSLTTSAAPVPAGDRPPVGAGALEIRIDSMSPPIPRPGQTVTIRGTVTNISQLAASDVSVHLRISASRVSARSDIRSVIEGRAALLGVAVPGVTDQVAGGLAAGQSAEFQLIVPVSELGLDEPGAYVIGAEVRGDVGSGVQRQDLDRTFLPWWPPGSGVEPLTVALLWPITGRPIRDAQGILLDDELAVDMSPAGRLSTLVAAGAARPETMTWVIDPEVLEAAAAMSQGYQVHERGGGPVPGTRTSEVSQWLDEITVALSGRGAPAIGALYALPDVMAARSGRILSRILRSRPEVDATTRALLGRPLPSRLALIPGGNVDDATLDRLARLGVGPVVLADWAMAPTVPTTFTPSGTLSLETPSGDLPVLLTDAALGETLGMPTGTPSDVTALRQRLLAETLVTAVELPTTQRLVVATPAADWSPSASGATAVLDAIASAPWIHPASVSEAVRWEPSTVPRTHAPYDAEQADAELPARHVRSVTDQLAGMSEYSEVLSPDVSLPRSAALAPARQLAGWFRTRPEPRAELTGLVNADVAAALTSVTVVSSGSITVSGSSGTIPITVENKGGLPVTVGLELTSDPPLLFQSDPVEPFEIAPARRTSVEVVATVGSAGQIPVAIQVMTVGGDAFGEPVVLTVRSSAYANAARVLVQVALAMLVLAVVVHGVRRARRRRRAGSGSAAPGGDDDG